MTIDRLLSNLIESNILISFGQKFRHIPGLTMIPLELVASVNYFTNMNTKTLAFNLRNFGEIKIRGVHLLPDTKKLYDFF
jgi:hypothetical protein